MNDLAVASVIFSLTYLLIISERVHKTAAALIGGVAVIAFRVLDQEEAFAAIDLNVIFLLVGMMVIANTLGKTGAFQWLAIRSAKAARGNPLYIMLILGVITALGSAFLDNVTTVVLIAPVTILICEILGISSQPFLMAEALLSDTGGVATLVGDPPNILIGSAAGLTFLDFLTHSLPIVIVVWLSALGILYYLYRKELSGDPTDLDALMELNPRDALKDSKTARKTLIVISGTVIFFLFEEVFKVRPALVALGGAAVALVWVRPVIQETLKRIQWDVLIFFAALFVMIGGMQSAGVFQGFISLAAPMKILPPVLLGLILLWIVAVLSAVVDNVPITIALIPVIQGLGSAGIPTAPLWWALVFGAGFGGNGTIIGSTANIVVASLSEKTRNPITPMIWNKRGLPVMIGTTFIASICYLLLFSFLGT